MKVGVFIPIRLASERLPAKCLIPVGDKTFFEHLVSRLLTVRYVKSISDIVVCTTNQQEDDRLFEFAAKIGTNVYRGSTLDLIDRMYNANKHFKFDVILQVDGDDPLVPPEYCDYIIESLVKNNVDTAYTAKLPFGLNVKAFTAAGLEKVYKAYASKENDTGFGLYFLDQRICSVCEVLPRDVTHEHYNVRLTLDYIEDFKMLSAIVYIVDTVYRSDYSLDVIMDILNKNKDLVNMNWWRQVENIDRTNSRMWLTAVIEGRAVSVI